MLLNYCLLVQRIPLACELVPPPPYIIMDGR
jgi:hypothetical protein